MHLHRDNQLLDILMLQNNVLDLVAFEDGYSSNTYQSAVEKNVQFPKERSIELVPGNH